MSLLYKISQRSSFFYKPMPKAQKMIKQRPSPEKTQLERREMLWTHFSFEGFEGLWVKKWRSSTNFLQKSSRDLILWNISTHFLLKNTQKSLSISESPIGDKGHLNAFSPLKASQRPSYISNRPTVFFYRRPLKGRLL